VVYQIKIQKSTNTVRTDPPVSRQDIQEWRSAIIAWVVDLPPQEPYRLSSKWGSRKGRSHLPIIFSRTLVSVGRSKIGLKSFCIEIGGLTLGAGITSANFQIRGTYASRTEALNIEATGSLTRGANSLNSQFRTPSGAEDLCILTLVLNIGRFNNVLICVIYSQGIKNTAVKRR